MAPSVPTSNAEVTAALALQEATNALTAGQKASTTTGKIGRAEAPDLAYAITQNLDALVGLLRTVDLDPTPSSSAEQSLHAIAQHLQQATGLARRAAGGDVPAFGAAIDLTTTPDGDARDS